MPRSHAILVLTTEGLLAVTYHWEGKFRHAFTPRGEYAPVDPPEYPELHVDEVTRLVDNGEMPLDYEELSAAVQKVIDDEIYKHGESSEADDESARIDAAVSRAEAKEEMRWET